MTPLILESTVYQCLNFQIGGASVTGGYIMDLICRQVLRNLAIFVFQEQIAMKESVFIFATGQRPICLQLPQLPTRIAHFSADFVLTFGRERRTLEVG
jgi:hypothetical protein